MPEKNILGYFHQPTDAQNAEKALHALGVKITKINEVGKYDGDGVDRLMNPLNSDFDSLATLTLGADPDGRNEGILMSADVSASGMSSGSRERGLARDPNILLTAVMDESLHKEALKIVEKYGGTV